MIICLGGFKESSLMGFSYFLKNMAVAVGFIVPIKQILHELRYYLLCQLHGRESVLELYWLK